MKLSLLLPWFPILLGVGVGGRLLGRTRGLGLGLLCALFWILLTQASAGVVLWQQPWTVASVVLGAVAIAAMGAWAGDHEVADLEVTTRGVKKATPPGTPIAPATDSATNGTPSDEGLEQVSAAVDAFDSWLAEHRGDADPWPAFGEFLRATLYACCRATHVRPYRLSADGNELIALRDADPLAPDRRLGARAGIVGHVLTTGRPYCAGDRSQGELVAALAQESDEPTAWCFAITRGTQRLGVVTVGRLDLAPEQNRALLRAVARLLAQFWCLLDEALRARAAGQYDPISGLRTRPCFMDEARKAIAASYAAGEPVALAVIALEGLRSLNDSGRWEVADELVHEVSAYLRIKIRSDDCLGRFDGSRFILLLRRVDSELATLIVRQIATRLTMLCNDSGRWSASIHVRCGLAGSGIGQPDPRTLISRALTESRRARNEQVTMASDLKATGSLVETAR